MATILEHRGQVLTHDFVGCMQTLAVNGIERLGQTSLKDAGVQRSCPRTNVRDVCEGHLCKNGGQCVAEWTGPVCHCTPMYMGTHCEEGKFCCHLNKT